MINPHDFDCKFRQGTSDDRERLWELASPCWLEVYECHVALEILSRFQHEDGAYRYVSDFLPFVRVAVIDGEVVGMISLCHGYITGLYVDLRFRGNLIGTSLLHNAWLDGGTLLEVSARNVQAIRFYKRRGWRKILVFRENVLGARLMSILMARESKSATTSDVRWREEDSFYPPEHSS